MRISSLDVPDMRQPRTPSATVEAGLTEAPSKVPPAALPEPLPSTSYKHFMRCYFSYIACLLVFLFSINNGLADTGHPEVCDAQSSSQAELSECYGNAYKQTDAELNALYKQIEGRLTNDEATRKLLVSAQRAWLAFRDAECDFSTSIAAGGTIHPMIYTICLDRQTAKRIDDFKTYLKCQVGDLDCPVPVQ